MRCPVCRHPAKRSDEENPLWAVKDLSPNKEDFKPFVVRFECDKGHSFYIPREEMTVMPD